MGILQNGYRDVIGVFRIYGGTVRNSAYPQESVGNWHLTGKSRNVAASEGITNRTTSVPVGYRHPSAWILAQKSGGLGCTGDRILGSGSIPSFNLAGGLNAESTIAGVGGISDAAMGLIMSAVATLAGTGSMSGAASALLSAIATLSGTSTMSAPLGAIAGGLATLSGQGGVCCSNLTADAYMSSDIAPATTVAADVIARAVLDVVVENNLTLADVQRLLLAVAAGDATGLDSNPVFKSQDGTTDRITGTLAGGNRTVTGVNP